MFYRISRRKDESPLFRYQQQKRGIFFAEALRLQREADYEVGFLRTGVSYDLGEEGDGEGVGNLDVLRSLEGDVRHGKAGSIVEGRGIGHCTDGSRPFARG